MIPTTLITGFLGSGKTTAILDAFQHRPPGERWAVLVNEFGRIGIDGEVLDDGGLSVREIAGGCVCCTATIALRAGIVRILREIRPDRLIIEPSGLAHPAVLIDLLRSPGIREVALPRAVITLVDPRRLGDPRLAENPTFADQLQIADILIANFDDVASVAELDRFRAIANAAWPPKLVIATTHHGHLDPAWLDRDPSPAERATHGPTHDTSAASSGFTWPPGDVFDDLQLESALHAMVRPCAAFPAGILRLKGIFHTRRGWRHVDATSDTVRWRPIGHRRDSRVDIIAPVDPMPAFEQAEAALSACRAS